MVHVLRCLLALGCVGGLVVANGCVAQTSPEGGDQQKQEAVGEPVGEVEEDVTTVPGGCNINLLPAKNITGTCAGVVCSFVDPSCCKTSWGGRCVEDALSICRGSLPVTCDCPHPVCVTGAALDYGCPGRATVFPECTARVCDARPSCCGINGGTWDSTCVSLTKSICFHGGPCAATGDPGPHHQQ